MKRLSKKDYNKMGKIINSPKREMSNEQQDFIRMFYKAYEAHEKIEKGRKLLQTATVKLIDENLKLKYNKDFDNPTIKVKIGRAHV